MLYKNSIRKIKKNPFEFFLFTLFFTIGIFVFVMMNTSLISMKDSFKIYLKKQNIEDFSFTINKDINLKDLSKKNNFYYEIEKNKWIQKKDLFLEIYPYEKTKKINIPYLIKGKFPKKGEITISNKFAKENHIKIGDTFKINKKKYIISGYAYHPSTIYMMVAGKIYSSHKNISNIYMYKDDYESLNTYENITYVSKYKDKKKNDFFINYLAGTENPFKKMEKEVDLGETLIRMMKIYYISLNFELYHIFARGMFYIFIFLCLLTYLLMFQKKVKKEKRELALLKMMGYEKYQIILSYSIYPLCSFILGLIIGIILGYIFHYPFMNLFLKSYQLPILTHFKGLNVKALISIIFLLLFVLMFYIFCYLKKDVLSLLKEKTHKISFVKKIIKIIISKLSFLKRIQVSLILERIGISLFAFILSTVVSFLLLFVLIGKDAVNEMISSSFKSITYDYEIFYTNVQTKKRKGDLVLKYQGIYKKDTIILYGIKNKNKYIKSYILKNSECVINKTLALKNKIKVKDFFKIKIDNKEYTFKVKKIEDNYQDSLLYLSFNELNHILNFKDSYNIRYVQTKNKDKLYEDDVYYINSIEESKESMRNVFSIFETLITLLFISSSICLIFLFWFLSNTIVEDHKKNILLFKLFGYTDKEIEKIFLHQYHYIIILSYLLGIFLIIPFFKLISSSLLKENFVFDFNFSFYKFILGFILLFLGYNISMRFAKKTLEEYSISELLKREE